MSASTKRKHVLAEMKDSIDVLPDEQKGEMIVRIVSPRGNNLHEAESPIEGQKNFLVSMPNKFRKNVWVKRGDFVIVSPIEEGDKVKGEIAVVLYKENIKFIKEQKRWPKKFDKPEEEEKKEEEIEKDSYSSDDDDDDLFQNTNRPVIEVSEDESEEETSEDEEEH